MPETLFDHPRRWLGESRPVAGAASSVDVEPYLLESGGQLVTGRWQVGQSWKGPSSCLRGWQFAVTDEMVLFPIGDVTVVAGATECPLWLVSALREVGRVADLPSDWDGEGSPPPFPAVLAAAARLLLALAHSSAPGVTDPSGGGEYLLQDSLHYSLPSPFVCPLRDGGVQIEWRQDGRELEIGLSNAQHFEYLKVFVDGSMEEGAYRTSDVSAFRRLVEWLEAGV